MQTTLNQTALNNAALDTIRTLFPTLSVLVLIGSRASGKAQKNSDWDFAFFFSEPDDFLRLALTEQLRATLADLLACDTAIIDLVDIRAARLAMRDVIAHEGIIILTKDDHFWFQFLEQTKQELASWQQGHE